jgi:hypothetical protein
MKILFLIFLIGSTLFATDIFDTSQKTTTILDIDKNKATIGLGDLIVGQSGVIVHKFDDNHSAILANFYITSSNKQTSQIKILKDKVLLQDAVPTVNLTPQKGNIVVVNHIYKSSLLIVPNFETSQQIKNLYKNQNFLNPDIFAAYLKINYIVRPQKEDFVKFCKDNTIGNIFIAIKDKLYIVDIYSFKILYTNDIISNNDKIVLPFFTKVKDIQSSMLDWSSPVKDYNKYYSKLIGVAK